MVRYKEFRTGDVLNIDSTKGIYHACNVQIDTVKKNGNHPYVVRTSQNNGLRGYISADESTLNPGRTISFAQDTAQMFYQAEPYFTGNKVKVMSIKGREMTENIALFLIACLNKAFSMFGWGQSYDVKILQDVKLSLPVTTAMMPDWAMLETLLRVHGGAGMSKIDTSSWKKFKLSDLFTAETGDVDLQQKDVNGKGVALVSSGESNTGVIGKTDVPAKVISENTITVDMFGSVQYRDFPYKMVTHARVFALVPKEPIGQEVGLFLATLFRKLTTGFSYNNMCSWNKVKDLEIVLPVTAMDVPDWDYMQERIAELEQERIAELEQERIAELEQYLVATGLNDYTLTDEDLKTLSLSGFRGDEAGNRPAAPGVCKEMMEFKIPAVFDIKNGHNILKTDVILGSGKRPYVTAGEGNNSVMGHISHDERLLEAGNCIFIGGKTTVFSYQEEPFFSNDSHNLLLYCKDPAGCGKLVSLYMITQLEKALWRYSWNDSISFKKIQGEVFTLPIQTDATGQPVIDKDKVYHPDGFVPDWEYMEAYIRAIEKLVIRDVVDFKDAFIGQAKLAVAGKEAM